MQMKNINPVRGTWLAVLAALLCPIAMANDAPQELTVEAVRTDFDQLYATLKEAHFDLFARRDKADYDRLYLDMRKSFDTPLSPAAARLEFQRFVAFGNVAHAQIPLPFDAFGKYVEQNGKVLPFALRVVNDEVFITENTSGIANLPPGVRVTHIDGLPALEWLDALTTLISADHSALAYGLVEFWLPGLTWFLHGERDAITVTAIDADGKSQTLDIPFRTREQIRAARKQQATESLGIDFSSRELRLLDDGIAYLRPGPFYNTAGDGARMYDDREFLAFIDDAFEKIIAADTRDLVIDLRNNPGGDKAFSDPMIAWFADREFQFYSSFRFKVSAPTRKAMLEREEEYKDLPASPARVLKEMADLVRTREDGEIVELQIDSARPREGERYTGRVYAIVNRHSYSNATAVAALLQDYEFATIVGEATNDLPSSYGAMETFTLKHSGIDVHYPKSWFVRPSGDASARGVQPDVAIATPVVETAADVVLEATLEEILGRR